MAARRADEALIFTRHWRKFRAKGAGRPLKRTLSKDFAMEALLARIAAETGLDAQTAKTAVGHILAFIQKEGDDPAVGQMIAETPGTEDAMASAGEGGGGGGGGLMGGLMSAASSVTGGGGIMGLGAKLMGLGLGMSEIKTVAEELVAFAKQHADPETVDKAIASVPGLSQYV